MHSFPSSRCTGALLATAAIALTVTACSAGIPKGTPPTRAELMASDPSSTSDIAPRALTAEFDALIPRGLTTMGAATLGDGLYILGGYFGPPHEYSREFQVGSFTRLNLSTGIWDDLPGVDPIQSPALVSDGRYIYKLGGMHATNAAGEPQALHSLATAARFDTRANRWEPITNLPEPRSSHQAVIVGRTVYVLGGWVLAGGMYDSTWSTTLLTADLDAPRLEWKSTPVPFRVRAFGLVAYRGKLHVLGGLTPEESTDSVQVYDLETRVWSSGPGLPPGNMTTRGVEWRGQLYANGGDGNVYRLSGDGQRWEAVGSVKFPRLFHEIVHSERGPLVIGGVPSNGGGARIRLIERLSDKAAAAGVVWTLPGQSPARNRQGAFLAGQQLYVFGGNNSLEQHDFARTNFVSTARRLDLGALEWRPVSDFPAARQSMQALAIRNADEIEGLAIGGFGFKGDHTSAQADVFSYHAGKDEWTRLDQASLPEPRSQFGLAEWDDAAWLFGGLNFDAARGEKDQFRLATQIVKLDLRHPESGFKDAGVALKEPRRAFAGGLMDGRYYLTGGLKDDFNAVASCEVIELKTRQSSAIGCPSEQHLGGELVPIKGRLYLVGGSVPGTKGEREPSTKIEVYEPVVDRWSVLPSAVPLDSTGHLRAFAFKDQLLLYTANRADGTVQVALLDTEAMAMGNQNFRRMSVPAPAYDGVSAWR
jgi:N-acetylneuraminic acid mutarotase